MANSTTPQIQAIGAAPDAVVMKRVVSFYEKLPRGPAPEIKPQGFWGKYQAKHFGKNPSAKRTSIIIYMLSRVEKKPGKGPKGGMGRVRKDERKRVGKMLTDENSHCSRHCRSPDRRLCSELLLPPP